MLRQEIFDAIQAIETQGLPPQVAYWVNTLLTLLLPMFSDDLPDSLNLLTRLQQAIVKHVLPPEVSEGVEVDALLGATRDLLVNIDPLMDLAHEVEKKHLSLTEAIEKALELEVATILQEDSLPMLVVAVNGFARINRQRAYTLACLIEALASHNNFTLQGQVTCALLLGPLGYDSEDPQFVMERLGRALALCQREKVPEGEAEVLFAIGGVYWLQRHVTQAQENYQRALKIFTNHGYDHGRARTLLSLGQVALFQGRNEQAEECYTQALALFREEKDEQGQAGTLHALGELFLLQGSHDQADDYFKQALDLFANLTDAPGLSHLYSTIGDLHKVRGLLDQAVAYYEKALVPFLAVEDNRGRAQVGLSIGEIRLLQGQYALAQRNLEEALQLYAGKDLGAYAGQASARLILGELFLAQGQNELAWENFTEALHLQIALDDKRGQIRALLRIGEMQLERGQYQESLTSYRQALSLCLDVSDRPGQAHALLGIGKVHCSSSEDSEALRDEALPNCQHALKLYQELGDLSGRIGAYEIIGRLWWRLSDLPQASEALQKALETFEDVRSHQQRESTRRTLSDRASSLYAMMVGLCLEQDRFTDAWYWVQRSKGRALLDLLRRKVEEQKEEEQRQDIRPRMTPGQQRWYERWQRQVGEVERLEREIEQATNRHEGNRARMAENLSQLSHYAEQDIDFLRERLAFAQQEERRFRQQVTDMLEEGRELIQDDVPTPEALARLLRNLTHPPQMESDLTKRPLLVEYFLLDADRYVVFLLPLWEIHDGQRTLPLIVQLVSSLSAGTLQTTFQNFTKGLEVERRGIARRSRADVPAEAPDLGEDDEEAIWKATLAIFAALPEQLYDTFIHPWRTALEQFDPTALLIVPHGSLHQLPLHAATFPDGQLLIEHYPLVYLSSATLASMLDRRRQKDPRPQGRLVMGPPGNDLEGALRETNRLAEEWQLQQGEQLYQFEAMKIETLLKHAGSLQITHLATHSVFNLKDYLRSHIQFFGEHLTLFDLISDQRFDFRGTRLFYLGSCESGRAHISEADELGGFIWALVYAGAHAVMATLWSADDYAGYNLAEAFYEHWQPGVSPMVAYREALCHVRQELAKFGEEYTNPYYWAPFMLFGDGFAPLEESEAVS